MIRRSLLGCLCVLALGGQALANGRPPGTSTINFRRGMESEIVAGMTFGVLVSKDNGVTWHWVCEDAVGYGGMYDPDYVYTRTGALFATTFDGLKVNRDGCVYEPTSVGMKFVSTATLGPDDAVYFAAADPLDSKIYKSTDNGLTFPTSADAGQLNDWYSTLEVAASDPNRLYLTGYRFVTNPNGPGNIKVFLLFTSTNGGTSWTPLPVDDFVTMPNSTLEIVGISKTNPLHVFAKVTLEDNAIADAIYRSTDGGQNWTRILGKPGAISFLVRNNGDLVAGTQTQGTVMSTAASNGNVWTDVVGAPHISCLAENAAGEVWACTQNYAVPNVPSDGFGIMKSTNLTSWTGVIRYQDIQEPLACPAGTVQKTTCDEMLWCGLCLQLGCDPKRECPVGAVDGVPDGGVVGPPSKPGCCENSASGPPPGALAIGTIVGLLLLRRRRRDP